MDIFYDIHALPRKQQKALIEKAYGICKDWWFDELDCRKSFARLKVEVSFEEAMSHFVDKAHAVVIHRDGKFRDDGEYVEVGFRSMENPIDYFLWIIVPIEKKDDIVEGLGVL